MARLRLVSTHRQLVASFAWESDGEVTAISVWDSPGASPTSSLARSCVHRTTQPARSQAQRLALPTATSTDQLSRSTALLGAQRTARRLTDFDRSGERNQRICSRAGFPRARRSSVSDVRPYYISRSQHSDRSSSLSAKSLTRRVSGWPKVSRRCDRPFSAAAFDAYGPAAGASACLD